MFKLTAFLFLVLNGVSAEHPSGSLTAQQTFPSEEACMNYFDTDAGKIAKQHLDEFAAQHNVAPKFSCVKIEDNSI